VVAAALLIASCGSTVRSSPPPSPVLTSRPASAVPSPVRGRSLSATEAQQLVSSRVVSTLDALKRRDGSALAAVAHPTKGVRFTPYPFVSTVKDVVLMRSDLASAYTDATKRTWGITDGRGDPIVLTFADYNTRYVWSRDFLAASRTSYNKPIGTGNSIDNTADIYPNAILFEAYDPGPVPAEETIRWQSLRLLFEQDAGAWYLVGVVHGEWTI
jgi:hypothetical protein